MADKHTPTPWEFDGEIRWENTPGEQEIHTGNYDIYIDGGNTIIANVNGQIPEGKVNVALIVRAVNCHEELVAVLQEFLRVADTRVTGSECQSLVNETQRTSRAALAKVKASDG